jgi:hypothetical protein
LPREEAFEELAAGTDRNPIAAADFAQRSRWLVVKGFRRPSPQETSNSSSPRDAWRAILNCFLFRRDSIIPRRTVFFFFISIFP